MAYTIIGIEKVLESAILGAEIILTERITDETDSDYGPY